MNEAEKRQNEYINQTAERVENRYDFKKAEKDAYRLKKGLTPEIVEELSAKKMTLNGCVNFAYVL